MFWHGSGTDLRASYDITTRLNSGGEKGAAEIAALGVARLRELANTAWGSGKNCGDKPCAPPSLNQINVSQSHLQL